MKELFDNVKLQDTASVKAGTYDAEVVTATISPSKNSGEPTAHLDLKLNNGQHVFLHYNLVKSYPRVLFIDLLNKWADMKLSKKANEFVKQLDDIEDALYFITTRTYSIELSYDNKGRMTVC